MSLGCKDIGIRKSKFVAKTQFLYVFFNDLKTNIQWSIQMELFKTSPTFFLDVLSFKIHSIFKMFLKRSLKLNFEKYL